MSLADVCSAEGRPISGFQHADWQPADELAGPYAVRVAVQMPGVIPGQAQISVRVTQGSAQRVLVQVAQWQVGRKGAPSPDVAQPATRLQ